MASYFEDITKVFNVALIEFGEDNDIPVALENIDAPTSTDSPYLSSYMLLANTVQADLGFSEERAGIYQVDIAIGSHLGSEQINKLADQLNAVFRAGAFFQRNEICAEVQSVSLTQLMVGGGWAKRSLNINFTTFTKRL